MHGKIRTNQHCPQCNRVFNHVDLQSGLICPTCHTTPKTYYIDLCYQGQRIKIYKDRAGELLDSYHRAVRLLERIRSEIDSHSFDPSYYKKCQSEQFQFSRIAKKYFELTNCNLAPSTAYSKQNKFKNHILPFFGDRDIRELRGDSYQEFIRKLVESGLENSVQITILKIFKAIINQAYKWGYLEKLPEIPSIKGKEKPIGWIDWETQIRVLRLVNRNARPLIRFLLLTGCRIAEARALQWDCVDFLHKTIMVKRTFSLEVLKEYTKTSNWRPLPMSQKVYSLLMRQRHKGINSPFVFTNLNRNHHLQSISKKWQMACKRSGVKEISLYQGSRHSFLTQRLNEGVDIKILKEIAGHSNIKQTERYAKLLTTSMVTAMESAGRRKEKVVSIKRRGVRSARKTR